MSYRVAVQPDNPAIAAAKTALRQRVIAARRSRSDADRLAARAATTGHLLRLLRGVPCVAGYLPLPTEPLDADLLDRLAATTRVLVPVVTGAAPLDWCVYPGPVRRGALGIDEPVGDRLGPDAIAQADVILVPALAVDPRGQRLGRGGGHYDRTLALQARLIAAAVTGDEPGRSGTRIAVVFDEELLHSVPADGLDQRVHSIVAPLAGYRSFP